MDQPAGDIAPAADNERASTSERMARADRAFALYCQGMRPTAIAAELGASATSVRRWLRASLHSLADETRDDRDEDSQDERRAGEQAALNNEAMPDAPLPSGQLAQVAQLVRAIESQRAIALAAWDAYERERAVEDAILRGKLDRVRRRAIRPDPHAADAPALPAGRRRSAPERATDPARARRTARIAASGESVSEDPEDEMGEASDDEPLATAEAEPTAGNIVLEEYERPRHTSQGARYLAVALAAQREVARLQGLYEHIERALPGVHIILSRRPDGPENLPPTIDERQPN